MPGKITNFLWHACCNCLPTADALNVKHVNVSLVCTWCQNHTENAIHVLFQCEFAQKLWRSTGFQNIVTLLPHDTVMTVLQRVFDVNNKDQCAMVGLLCWGLWFRRNQWVWEHVTQSVYGMKAMVFNMLTDWKKAKEETERNRSQQ